MEIAAVKPGSVAERAGLRAGEYLVTINGEPIRDMVDYLYLSSEEELEVEVESPEGKTRTAHLVRRSGEDLGLEPVPDPILRCPNRCIFCFVDQMPENVRPSLCIKDEDYRLSFLHGSYVTLTNLDDEDYERIGEQRLSPLYVSVHATDPELRGRMLRNRRSGDVMGPLRKLAGMRITIHAQVVLCPGINDGAHLKRTVEDLLSLYPSVESVALVPVGLTRHRDGLPPLSPCTPQYSRALISTVSTWQRRCLNETGTRGVFLADEFYLLAGTPFPRVSDYEAMAQIENGVGMTPRFLEEIRSGLESVPQERLKNVEATLVTGTLMGTILEEALARPIRHAGGQCGVLAPPNRFLGESVTVSGLLAGADIWGSLRGLKEGARVFLPPNCVNEDGVFLDDGRPEDLGTELGLDVRVASAPVDQFLAELTH
ncbi:MAG: DUF512 domain-containing protein [Candidatus Eisenbacteria sp.]|nr:DUF512 domain-containing protein [Candidatus Eisenbacteria bacterium]